MADYGAHGDHGDRVFCHACGAVWLKDDDGLTCPHCESGFTEIIEIPPDNVPQEPLIEPDSTPASPWEYDNPWSQEDLPRTFGFMNSPSPSSPRYSQHTYRSPGGQFTFTSTSVRGGYSNRHGTTPMNPAMPMMMQGLGSILQALSETGADHRGPRAGAMDPFHPDSPGWDDHDRRGVNEADDPPEIYPRDADAPHTTTAPVGTLAEYVPIYDNTPHPMLRGWTYRYANRPTSLLETLRRDFGRPERGGAQGAGTNPLANPLAMLSVLLNMDRNGDAVYSQEELDRVISQLIDHNAAGTAPPGASTTAIQSLPKKKVDQQMLGSDGTAECSICMDMVELGTEVTVLPCTHWFHFSCIEAWLVQHNTCPHCRRSIDSASGTPRTTRRTRGEGTSDNPIQIPSSPENPTAPSPQRRRRSSPFASLSGRSSFSRNSRNSQAPATPDLSEPGPETRSGSGSGSGSGTGTRRSSRSSRNSRSGESGRGGFTGWVWSRFGGGNT